MRRDSFVHSRRYLYLSQRGGWKSGGTANNPKYGHLEDQSIDDLFRRKFIRIIERQLFGLEIDQVCSSCEAIKAALPSGVEDTILLPLLR